MSNETTKGRDSEQQWRQYIKNRIVLAHEWRRELSTHKSLAEAYRYIRILGRNFRAISLSSYNPCGRLVHKENGKEITGKLNISAAIQSILDAEPFNAPSDFRPEGSKPGRHAKPEHGIQAFIIRHSLMNNLNFREIFPGLGDEFDDLLFITDELSTGDLRADVIALGSKEGRYFPVFIELKITRSLKRLIEQLESAPKLLTLAEADFVQFLSAVSGISENQISFKDYRLMLIWSKSPSGKESKDVAVVRSRKILTVHYSDPNGDGKYVFERVR